MIDSGLDSIRFSVNGATRESYYDAHGKDDFLTVVENIKMFHTIRQSMDSKINISISMIATKKTRNERSILAETFGDFVDQIVCIPVVGLEKFATNFQEVYALENEKEPEYVPCISVFNTMYISSFGTVQPCCAGINNPDMTIDTVGTGKSLVEIWNSDKCTRMRNQFSHGELPYSFCNGCFLINKSRPIFIE